MSDYSSIPFKNNGKLKLLIIVGTRPEIIRLAAVINKTRKYFDVILAHTGQNYDYNLNGVFFHDLQLADPEVYMNAVGADLGETMGNIISESYKLMAAIRPDAVLVLGDAALRTDTSDNLYLPISQIEPYANQPRRHFDEEALQDLADSIREHGIIQPLTVRRLSSGYYQIIAGERRWRAARIAGLAEVPAIVIEADDRKMTELSLIENLQREDLDPIEEAEGYKTLMDNYHLTQEEAAERVGKSRSAVANSLRLLGLCPEVRQMLQNGDLSGGHARALLPLKADLQLDAANLIVKQGLSVRQTEALAKRLSNPKEERKPTNDELIAESYGRLAAQELSDKIGRTCRIVSGKKKGRIELDYYGIDDLNDLLEALAAIKRRKNGGE